MNIPRYKIYSFIEPEDGKTIYDYLMIVIITASLVPLCFKNTTPLLKAIDYSATLIFIIDYALRWFTADCKLNKGAVSFVIYPFTIMALIDLASILPFFLPLASSMRALRIVRLIRSFRVFRAFKMLRYSNNMRIIVAVIKNQAPALFAVCTLAVGYVFVSALLLFNTEPDTFNSFFDALYLSTISLTTIGYGDIYPVTPVGQFMSMLSSFVGVAVIALPSGIITAGYIEEIKKNKEESEEAEAQ